MRSLLSIICCLAILLTCIGGIAIASADKSVQFTDEPGNLDQVTSATADNLKPWNPHSESIKTSVMRKTNDGEAWIFLTNMFLFGKMQMI